MKPLRFYHSLRFKITIGVDLHNRAELIKYAIRRGIIDVDA